MHYTLLHISDLHTGWHFDLKIAEDLARQAHEVQPDLLVISGDLVLRSDLLGQWYTIMAYLKMLPQPQLIVPGNHDVSLFNGFYRLLFPLRRYRRYVSENLNPVFTRPGLAVIGGCSAHGLTIDGGYLYPGQVKALEHALSSVEPDACKVMVLHHHVVDPPGEDKRRKIGNASVARDLINRHGVELFLCGHVHLSYVCGTQGVMEDIGHNMVISQCGTTTSRRGRGQDRGKNSFHVITIDDRHIRVTPHFYDPGGGRFAPLADHVFVRQTATYEKMATTAQAGSPRAHLHRTR